MDISIMILSLFMILIGLNILVINHKLDDLIELMGQNKILKLIEQQIKEIENNERAKVKR